jgi:protein-S-isoprenylcysteine O-methyltransferase Ste14
MEKVTRNAAVYYMLQGLAVVGWWVLIIGSPDSRARFQLEADSQISLWAYWLPDLLLIGPGSFVGAALVYNRNRFATAALWLVSGAVTYATLHSLAIAMITDRGWLGVALMLAATLWSGVFAMALSVGGGMFREAKQSSVKYILFKTLSQIVIVWSLILIVLPYVITILERKLGIARLEFSGQRPLGAILFVFLSVPGVWAAIVMSRFGKGTPLPLDHARNLVVQGPYSHVRNPMALSGVGQGLAVALFLGSPLVAAYALMGSAIWQLIFRPLEEDDMTVRFGKDFLRYSRNVTCWFPKLRGYQIEGAADSSISTDSPLGRM